MRPMVAPLPCSTRCRVGSAVYQSPVFVVLARTQLIVSGMCRETCTVATCGGTTRLSQSLASSAQHGRETEPSRGRVKCFIAKYAALSSTHPGSPPRRRPLARHAPLRRLHALYAPPSPFRLAAERSGVFYENHLCGTTRLQIPEARALSAFRIPRFVLRGACVNGGRWRRPHCPAIRGAHRSNGVRDLTHGLGSTSRTSVSRCTRSRTHEGPCSVTSAAPALVFIGRVLAARARALNGARSDDRHQRRGTDHRRHHATGICRRPHRLGRRPVGAADTARDAGL